ncbi:hypothetical protein ACSF85_09470 [Moraxella bovoculi]|uniref:hypothetical protein n=1 Tax=Moraxella bovoculi TaxID=386891 RepID=UPI003F4FE91D
MFYVRVNRGEFNLKHIKTICGRVLVWNEEHHQLSDDQIKKLQHITQPTLDTNQHRDEIYKLCLELRDTMVLHDDKGRALHFMVDKDIGWLYFGDDEGLAEAKALSS